MLAKVSDRACHVGVSNGLSSRDRLRRGSGGHWLQEGTTIASGKDLEMLILDRPSMHEVNLEIPILFKECLYLMMKSLSTT